jgi:hypothetical protein
MVQCLTVAEPSEDDVRGLDDASLLGLQYLVADELRERAFNRVERTRWTVGKLRSELLGLPDDLPLLVNAPGRVEGGIIPLVVTGGGFRTAPAGVLSPEDEIFPIYNIDTEQVDPANGRLIWIVASA